MGQTPQVTITRSTMGGSQRRLTVAPISIDVYRFAVAQ